MMKRVLQIAALGGALLLVASGGVWSYVTTFWDEAVTTVKNEIPVAFDIKRAKSLVQGLIPEIRKNIGVIAAEAIEVEELENQISMAGETLAQERADILRLRADLGRGKDCYVYAGKDYSRAEVMKDVAIKFERYKSREAEMESLKKIKEAREQSLKTAQQKLDEMVETKRRLEVQVEQLAARLRTQQVAQSASDVRFDDSKVGEAREAISEIRKRLDMADRVLNSETTYFGEIEVNSPAMDDVMAEITEYFGDQSAVADARR